MQSVVAILSPSAPLTAAVAGPILGSGTDPDGGFGRLLAERAVAGADEEAMDNPSGVEGMAVATIPGLLWAEATGGGMDGPGPAEAAFAVQPASRVGISGTVPSLVLPTDAVWPQDVGTPVQPIPVLNGGSDIGLGAVAMPFGEGRALPSGTKLVGTAAGEPDQTGKQPEVRGVGPGNAVAGQAREMTAPIAQPWIRDAKAAARDLSPGHDPITGLAQTGTGLVGSSPAVAVKGGTTGIGEGPGFGPAGIDAGLATGEPHPPMNPAGRRGTNSEMGKEFSAAQPTVTQQGTSADGGVPIPVANSGDSVSAPIDALQVLARGEAGRHPQASFWERLLSGVTDAQAAEKAPEDIAEPDLAARAEHRPIAPQDADAGSPLPIVPRVAAPTRPDAVDAVAPKPPGKADPRPPLTAEPEAPDKGRPASVATDQTAPAASGPHITPESEPPLATDLRSEVLALDPLRDRFGEAARLAVPGGLSLALQTVPGPATTPVTMPQLAAQVTAALSHGTAGETELALSPGELGHVRVKLKPDTANPDRLVVMITFERPETLDLFRRHAGELAEAFRAAGYAGADLGFAQQGSGQSDPRGQPAARGFDGTPSSEPAGDLHPSPRHSGAASLDLRL